jgi:hypothetical protein
LGSLFCLPFLLSSSLLLLDARGFKACLFFCLSNDAHLDRCGLIHGSLLLSFQLLRNKLIVLYSLCFLFCDSLFICGLSLFNTL